MREVQRRKIAEFHYPRAAIRKHCLECCGGSIKEVALCTAPKCFLWPWRFGGTTADARAIVRSEKYAKRLVDPKRLEAGTWHEVIDHYREQLQKYSNNNDTGCRSNNHTEEKAE